MFCQVSTEADCVRLLQTVSLSNTSKASSSSLLLVPPDQRWCLLLDLAQANHGCWVHALTLSLVHTHTYTHTSQWVVSLLFPISSDAVWDVSGMTHWHAGTPVSPLTSCCFPSREAQGSAGIWLVSVLSESAGVRVKGLETTLCHMLMNASLVLM